MKTALPWIVAVLGIAAAAFFFNANKSNSTQLATLQQQVQELQTLRAENEALKTSQVPTEEIERLRKDSSDAVRLRNEVRQLRDQKTQLTQQAQSAATAAERAQAQAAQARAEATAIGERAAQQATTGHVASGSATAISAQDALNACINNLRQIDAAKQQWALENNKTATATPEAKDIAAYLGTAQNPGFPKCPAGGKYTIGAVNVAPTCSIPGHALPTN